VGHQLPIRRRSHPSPSRTWELVRQEIETYALMFPHVSFSLEDASRQIESSHPKERVIRIRKVSTFSKENIPNGRD
jgi:DNA mismatch repair protein MLH3